MKLLIVAIARHAWLQKSIVGGVLLLLCAGMRMNSRAATITMDPTNFYDVSDGPIETSGLTATFQDVSSGVVDLTLSVSGLGESYYNVNTWWFMASSTYANSFTISEISQTGSFTIPTFSGNQRATPTSEAGNDGYFNLWCNGSQNFEDGDSVTYKITSSVSGLTASAFDNKDSPTSGSYASGGSYYTAVYIIGNSQENANFYIGATTTTVPEPTTAGCFLLGLGALACCQRFTKNRRT
jgi:hypothetical protein